MVRITVWVVTAEADVPVANTVTSAVPGAAEAIPLIPHPDNPAVKASVPAISRQSCALRSFRLLANTASPVNPPGHQKTIARNVELSGLRSMAAFCALSFMVSGIVAAWLSPFSAT
jgi:hypothetical protein